MSRPCAFCSYHADCQAGTRPTCARIGDDLEVEYADWEPWHGGYERETGEGERGR